MHPRAPLPQQKVGCPGSTPLGWMVWRAYIAAPFTSSCKYRLLHPMCLCIDGTLPSTGTQDRSPSEQNVLETCVFISFVASALVAHASIVSPPLPIVLLLLFGCFGSSWLPADLDRSPNDHFCVFGICVLLPFGLSAEQTTNESFVVAPSSCRSIGRLVSPKATTCAQTRANALLAICNWAGA